MELTSNNININTIKNEGVLKNLLIQGCCTYFFFSPTYCIQLNIINYLLLYSNQIISFNIQINLTHFTKS